MLLLSILINFIWYIVLVLVASVVLIAILLFFDYVSDMIIYISQKRTEQRVEEERQRHDCSYCYYYKKGKCLTQYEKDCKENNYFIWLQKEKK